LATTRFQCAGGVKILGFLLGGVLDVELERFFVGGVGGTDIDEDRDVRVRRTGVGGFAERVIAVNKLFKTL
jgi:hypothetical protein